MATRTRKTKASLLDDRIGVLKRNAAGAYPAQQIYRTVSGILTLVRVSTLVLRSAVYSLIGTQTRTR